MAIGEAQRGGTRMANRRKIDPEPLSGLRHDKARVLDTVLVLIQEDEGLGRGGQYNL